MAKELINKPGWLETLWNVNPRLANEAENDLIRWIEEGWTRNLRLKEITKITIYHFKPNDMQKESDEDLKGVTLFTVECDSIGWKAVVTRDKQIVKQSYALDAIDAQKVRDMFVNEFWGNQLN